MLSLVSPPLRILARRHLLARSHRYQSWRGNSGFRASSTITGTTRRVSSFTAVGSILALVASGFTGYYIARSTNASIIGNSDTQTQYGTPSDFDAAIRQLKIDLPSEDIVSTDPDDLHYHGFSENDYHKGLHV